MARRTVRPLLALVLAALSACAGSPHVALSAPSPSAPAQERLAAYGRLRGLRQSETVVTDASGEVVGASADFVALGGGDIVTHPEDLLPLVAPDSATARAAHRTTELRAAAWPWQVAGLVVALAGAGLGTYGALAEDDFTLPGIGLGLLFVGTGLGGIPTIVYDQRAEAEQSSAFEHYDADLRARLDLCARGLEVVACGPAAAPAPPAPSAPSAAPSNQPNPARNPELDTSGAIQ